MGRAARIRQQRAASARTQSRDSAVPAPTRGGAPRRQTIAPIVKPTPRFDLRSRGFEREYAARAVRELSGSGRSELEAIAALRLLEQASRRAQLRLAHAARARGLPWTEFAQVLGLTRQGAQRAYGRRSTRRVD